MKIKYTYSSALTGTLNYLSNGDLQVKNDVIDKVFSKNSMQAIANEYKGANRIHKPIALLFGLIAKTVNNQIGQSNKTMVEYIIWGVPENGKDEALLMEKFDGQNITDLEMAKRLVKILEIKFKCSKVRIQKIDITNGFNNDFTNTVNITN